LRRRFVDWIDSPRIRHLVSGYSLAAPRHGGDGAYYLFFRSTR
jgi:DNA-nicking Smr family endonuclease